MSGRVGHDSRVGLYIIGLTGNIATGKSVAARMLQELGARVLDADELAHRAMQKGTPVHDRIVCEFGRDILKPDGEIDRQKLGAIVFADVQALARLEALVHPAVIEEQQRILTDWHREGCTRVAVIEAIKLLESGMQERCDETWVVTSPRELQIERLVKGRGLSTEEATLRVDAQNPQSEKVGLADVVITNDGSLHDLRSQLQAEWVRVMQALEAHDTAVESGLGGEMSVWRKWADEHPALTMWVVLSVGMVAIFAFTSRDVPLLWHQRLFMAVACVGLAALCSWIVSWE